MVRLITSRLLQGAIVILGTTVAAFLLVRVIPSDPARLMAPQASEKQLQAMRAELGFDKPLLEQLAIFLGDAARGDFGNSVYLHDPVTSLIIEKFPLTLVLALCALCFALAVSLPLGVIAALQRDTIWDRLSLLLSISILSMPNFWLGLELLFLVAVRWQLLPAQGFSSWRNFILPSFTLSLTLMPIYIRMTRASMIDVLNQDFIKALVARGVPMRRIMFRHGLKNIAVPLLTILGVQFGQLLGGALVIELIFNFPGLGLLMFKAVLRRDYPLVQGITVVMASVFVLLNLLIDLSYSYLDPRIRQQELSK
jgi:peptide/nickel transport system permease protein